MPRSPRIAGERLLALLAAFGAATGCYSTAQAQTDPFALPSGITAQSATAQRSGPGLSEIAIDGETRVRLVNLAWQGDMLTIDAAMARAAGLPVAETVSGPIALDSLKVYKWRFDTVHQRLEVQLLRKSDGDNLIDMSLAQRQDGESSPLTALRVDYDLTATVAKGRSGIGGFADASLVRGNFALSSAFQFASQKPAGSSRIVRLDSQVQIALPRAGLTATGGDFVGAGGQSQRAVRIGGIQLASDYSLRPDLVTMPLPTFTGQVAVPTGIDVISGDQRYKLGEVQPGEFTVRNVPANVGRGEVAVIIRDSLGRETIQNTRFYVSRNLLAPNLQEFAVNAGFVRRRYGGRSAAYGPFVASAYFRRGLSQRLTVEGTGEWTSGLINVGARGDVVLGGLALATVETRFSHDNDAGKSGMLLNLGLESVGRKVSARIGAILPSPGYRDVASKLGDPLPPRQLNAQISFNLAKTTQFQLTASRQQRRFDPRYRSFEPRTDVANASFRTTIDRKVDFFASAGYRHGRDRAFTAWSGISIQLGGGRNAQGSVGGGTKTPVSGNAGFYRRDSEEHRLGYAFEASAARTTRLAASVAWRGTPGRVEAQAERVAGTYGLRFNARGTVLMAGGAVFARNQSGGSYALVRTGVVDGVTVMRENRPAGMTRGKGLLLIENIPAQVPLNFDIDPDKLPADALARATHRRIVVPRRAVGLVSLDVTRFRPVPIRLLRPGGERLPAGTVIAAQPSGERTMVGFDGVVDFNAAGGDRFLVEMSGDQQVCAADIDRAKLGRIAESTELLAFICERVPEPVIATTSPPPTRRGRAKLTGRRR